MYMGRTCFTAPTQCFQVFYMCTFQCCARVRDVVHVSQQLCTFHRSCARFTSPLIMFVFNCIGATKHVFPIYILYYTHKQQYVVISMMGKNLWVVVLTDNCNRKIIWPSKDGFLYHHIIGITCQSTRFTVTKVRSTFVWRWGNKSLQ